MKLLIAVLFLFLMVPQTADAIEIVWGTRDYKKTNNIVCTEPSKALDFRNEINRRVDNFVNTYKQSFLNEQVNKIYICRDLIVENNFWYRGTYLLTEKVVFVRIDDGEPNDTEYMLHHEFSSTLFHYFFTNEMRGKWIQNNDFSYQWYDIEKNPETWNDYTLMSRGGICKYATTNLENDFNSMASFYLTTYLKGELALHAFEYFRIKHKRDIIKEIYQPFLK